MHSFLRTRYRTNILEACQTSDRNALKLILEMAWTNKESRDAFNRKTPLHIVAESGNLELIKLLIQQNIDINVRDSQGSTPLHLACANGHLKAVHMLVGAGGAKINSRKEKSFRTPLHLASANGHAEVVEYLAHKFDGNLVDEITSKGRTALHIASQQGYACVVKALLECGADVTRKDNDGMTPLQIACMKGHSKLVHQFLNSIDDTKKLLDSQTRFGNTALDTALIHKQYECAEILMKTRRVDLNESKGK